MDLLTGLTAKQHGLPLLPADDGRFRRIPGWILETYRQTGFHEFRVGVLDYFQRSAHGDAAAGGLSRLRGWARE